LRPGDRLLEVNNVAMTGKTQSEAVSILRNAPPGGKVLLVVSRQEKGDESPKLPREIVSVSQSNVPIQSCVILYVLQKCPHVCTSYLPDRSEKLEIDNKSAKILKRFYYIYNFTVVIV
jgi:hypothetical protein